MHLPLEICYLQQHHSLAEAALITFGAHQGCIRLCNRIAVVEWGVLCEWGCALQQVPAVTQLYVVSQCRQLMAWSTVRLRNACSKLLEDWPALLL